MSYIDTKQVGMPFVLFTVIDEAGRKADGRFQDHTSDEAKA